MITKGIVTSLGSDPTGPLEMMRASLQILTLRMYWVSGVSHFWLSEVVVGYVALEARFHFQAKNKNGKFQCFWLPLEDCCCYFTST